MGAWASSFGETGEISPKTEENGAQYAQRLRKVTQLPSRLISTRRYENEDIYKFRPCCNILAYDGSTVRQLVSILVGKVFLFSDPRRWLN